MKNVYRFFPFVFLIQFVATTVVAQGTRQYYSNRNITGQTEDAQGVNYLLLHRIYTSTLMTDHHVMGKVTAIRGSASSSNRKWTVEVNTATAYNTNRGSIISYNEPASLVTLTYNGENYLAVSITNSSTLLNFSFTGYAQNESLTLVYDDNVSNVQSFTSLDPLTIQGNVGIGTLGPSAKLYVTGPQGTTLGKFTQSGIAANDAYLNIENTTSISGHFSPGIKARSSVSGRPWGLSLIGEADDIVPPGNEASGGAVVLDGRSKNGTSLVNNNVLMVNSYGTNLVAVKANGSVGIGVTDTKGYKLAVAGNMIAEKIKVKLQGSWPDYVFAEEYKLPPLAELATYIKENKHLPDMPSAEEVQKNGIDLEEINRKLLQKVEEMTLYIIDLENRIKSLESKRR